LKAKAQSYGFNEYARGVRSAVRGLWSGVYDEMAFYEAFYSLLNVGLTAAWQEGARNCGIAPDELTLDELKLMRFRVSEQMNYVTGFAEAIAAGSKENKGKLTPLLQRALMWVNRYNDVKNQAMQIACKDQKLMWVIGPTEQHCASCSKLDGRVYRASIWKKYDLRPQMWRLACRGVHCLCTLNPTTDRVTPGHPPSI